MRRNWFVSFAALTLSAVLISFIAWGLLPALPNYSNLDAAQDDDSARLQELRRLIENEIGTPSAMDPSQCRLIAFGSKPCGGPATYLVYSTLKTNEARLKQLVTEFNQLTKKINKERKMVSDCRFVTEPRVEFVENVCTTNGN